MKSYWSFKYLCLFLPIIVIIYNILPQKHRWKLLLLASYAFFWILSSTLIIYIIISTILIYFGGIWLSKIQEKRNEELKKIKKEEKKQIKEKYIKKQRKVLVLFSLILLGILIVLKYSGFIIENVDSLLEILNIKVKFNIPKFLMPVGISFYTLQAISYLVDIYKGKIKADKNFWRLALFISFFPQIMEGPICRYSETADQLWKCEKTSYQRLSFGSQRILFGFFKKFLIVDRVNAFIAQEFTDYMNFDGGMVAIGMFLYTFQLYMDFSGTMDVVIGTGEIFGVTMPENFKQPFFSKSISEFWTRWHITLGTWFRDYIFYPVSLTNRCKKITIAARKRLGNYYGPLIAGAIALFCVWICNGLWHGAAWSYIFFGMYHFALIILAKIFDPLFKKIQSLLHIDVNNFIYKGFQIIRTTLLVCVGELFFRANTLTDGINMFGKMITDFSLKEIKNGTVLNHGLDMHDFILIGVVLVIIFVISLLKEKGINIRESIAKQNVVLRWTLYYALILSIIIFGTYGIGYVPLDPMYANF